MHPIHRLLLCSYHILLYFKRHFRGITTLFQCTQSHQMISHWQLCISNNLIAPNQHQHKRFVVKSSSFEWPENISQQKSWRSTKLIRKHMQWNNDQGAGTKSTHWLHRKNTLTEQLPPEQLHVLCESAGVQFINTQRSLPWNQALLVWTKNNRRPKKKKKKSAAE